ncbi:hypothetical protein HHK36_020139 [Tetracentron sinense]|uniref:Peptidase A1 domain-containing protein n=1 Tax=Tetracentron sinense TaxID=13715 RepID=A0A834YYZ2_TETSI|nr:hypothetical protein HHK36_020139 [Tetracentron sinense]
MMDLRKLIFGLSVLVLFVFSIVSANGVFKVHHRFAGQNRSLNALKTHDGRRHRRFLSGVDLPMAGNGHPAGTGFVLHHIHFVIICYSMENSFIWLYFTKIGIGTPAKDYYVQVDTGSDILWVNCIQCSRCPVKSDLGIKLTLYNPKGSASGKMVTCDQNFCTDTYDGQIPGCTANLPCQYNVLYGDGSSTAGYFVQDFVHYDRVSGNLQTTSANGSVIFG